MSDDVILAGELNLLVDVNIDSWIKDINFNSVGISHGKTSENTAFVSNIDEENVFTTSAVVSVGSNLNNIKMFSVLNNGFSPEVIFDDLNQFYHANILSVEGKLLQSIPSINKRIKLKDFNLPDGTYILNVSNRRWEINSEKLIIKQ